MLAKVIDNDLKLGLPETGILLDGRTVSNYDLLPIDELTSEGWKPTEEIKPAFDETTQMLVVDTFAEQTDNIIVNYKVVGKPQDVYDYMLNSLGV